MKQITEFFKGLFATNKWPARWQCGEWSDFHGWLYIISDLMIWTAYFLIPLIILKYFAGKRKVIHFTKVYLLFALFILLCGSTHFVDAIMFWVPVYRFNALLRFVTGIISLLTVYHLVKILPNAFKQKTNIELEKEIARREEAERKFADANKNLEAFAYVASHDLQEPLRKIQTYTSMLYDRPTEQLDPGRKNIADKLMASSARMQTMIKDVLTLSTLKSDVAFTKTDTNEAVKMALEDLEIKILEKHAIINVAQLPNVHGNKEYLAQLFMNLISNAIKFSRDQPVVQISADVAGEKVIIYIRDNGIGMSSEYQHIIFDMFQRLHPKSEYEGSGIGLSISKRIVDLHHGNINVQSKLKEGTTFIIELPRA